MSDSIWLIQYNSRSYDWDNRREVMEYTEEEEGFFTSEAAAQQRCDALNASVKEQWAQEQAARRQQYAAALARWEDQQRQAAFLVANGFTPSAAAAKPSEPTPITYEDWLWRDGGRSDYVLLELRAAQSR